MPNRSSTNFKLRHYPLFADPEKDDFALKPGSPAARVGFRPINLREVGRRGAKPDLKEVPRAFPKP